MRRFYPFRLPDGDNDEVSGELLIIDIGKAPKRLSEVVLIVPKDSGYDSAMMMEWAEVVCQALEVAFTKKPKEEENGR